MCIRDSYYHGSLAVAGLSPPLGPERGGTRVAVLGSGFRDAYTLRCRFDNASSAVLARYVDEAQLECVTPLHSLGAKAVLLSMNAQQYSGGGVRYTYQMAAAVSTRAETRRRTARAPGPSSRRSRSAAWTRP